LRHARRTPSVQWQAQTCCPRHCHPELGNHRRPHRRERIIGLRRRSVGEEKDVVIEICERDVGVESNDLRERTSVVKPKSLLDEAQPGVVLVEEAVAVAEVLELLGPDVQLEFAELATADVRL
jgi:hypothetical protein